MDKIHRNTRKILLNDYIYDYKYKTNIFRVKYNYDVKSKKPIMLFKFGITLPNNLKVKDIKLKLNGFSIGGKLK